MTELFLLLVLGLALCLRPQAGEPAPSNQASFATRAGQILRTSQEDYHRAPTNNTRAWEHARACFDLAEFATNQTQRAELARKGIAACREVILRDPRVAPAQYYLGLNLGQLARTQSLGALKTVGEMESVLRQAAAMDSAFDYAGADRTLGLLYRDTPGWPISLGSSAKARRHLERAVALSPDFPENRLNLLEAYIQWKDKKGIQREIEALTALLPQARRSFQGEAWAPAWEDWDRRWQAVLERFRPAKQR